MTFEMPKLRLGTRGSDLALWQASNVSDLLSREAPMHDVEMVVVKTTGDVVQDRPIDAIGRTAVFTAELDVALQHENVELAVHSLKDVETTLAEGTVLAAVLPRGPVEDVLVSSRTFDEMPAGARIGTGSVRRTAQLRRLRPELEVVPVRGNVPTRLEKLDEGEYDGLLMARAGLVRLGFGHRISTVFEDDQMLHAVGQGAIAVTCRGDDEATRRILAGLDHKPTRRAVDIERACLKAVGGGCNVPLGVVTRLDGDAATMLCGLFAPDGSGAARISVQIPADESSEAAGERAAAELLEAGGRPILEMLERGA